jgi:partner of Y14 and mago
MASKTNSGIRNFADGSSVIPSSRRADGSVRKEIKVRPGFKPSEDIATYKTPNAELWNNRGAGGVPGADAVTVPADDGKSKNAKRREAARKKAAAASADEELAAPLANVDLSRNDKLRENWQDPTKLATNESVVDEDAEIQKKVRNAIKKLKAVRDLKAKKLAGEKLSADQLVKLSKEDELVRDLQKLKYDGPELES